MVPEGIKTHCEGHVVACFFADIFFLHLLEVQQEGNLKGTYRYQRQQLQAGETSSDAWKPGRQSRQHVEGTG